MHIHRLEKIWLSIGIAMLIIFLAIVGISGFAMGMNPPTSDSAHGRIDPTKVDTTPPFDKPGLIQAGDNLYEANMTAYLFSFDPGEMEIPVGSTVMFNITSKDVVHGFAIVGTTVNMMVTPGEINHLSYKFDKPGEYLVLCNEYCGTGHEVMQARIIVK